MLLLCWCLGASLESCKTNIACERVLDYGFSHRMLSGADEAIRCLYLWHWCHGSQFFWQMYGLGVPSFKPTRLPLSQHRLRPSNLLHMGPHLRSIIGPRSRRHFRISRRPFLEMRIFPILKWLPQSRDLGFPALFTTRDRPKTDLQSDNYPPFRGMWVKKSKQKKGSSFIIL